MYAWLTGNHGESFNLTNFSMKIYDKLLYASMDYAIKTKSQNWFQKYNFHHFMWLRLRYKYEALAEAVLKPPEVMEVETCLKCGKLKL